MYVKIFSKYTPKTYQIALFKKEFWGEQELNPLASEWLHSAPSAASGFMPLGTDVMVGCLMF